MSNTATIQIRLDPKEKKAVGRIFADLGLDISSGVKLYLKKVIEEEGVPFPVKKGTFLGYPNKEAYKKEVAWALKHGKRYDSAQELLDDIL